MTLLSSMNLLANYGTWGWSWGRLNCFQYQKWRWSWGCWTLPTSKQNLDIDSSGQYSHENKKESHFRHFVHAPFLVDGSLLDLSSFKQPLSTLSLLAALGNLACLAVGWVNVCPSFPIYLLIEMSTSYVLFSGTYHSSPLFQWAPPSVHFWIIRNHTLWASIAMPFQPTEAKFFYINTREFRKQTQRNSLFTRGVRGGWGALVEAKKGRKPFYTGRNDMRTRKDSSSASMRTTHGTQERKLDLVFIAWTEYHLE